MKAREEWRFCDLCDNVGEITPAVAIVREMDADTEYEVCADCLVEWARQTFSFTSVHFSKNN